MKKRALVLAGGGAMGAYTFGCLEAFKQAGLHFELVTGTSAGALNAALWSSDSLEEGRAIWEKLSFESIYPVKILDPKRNSKIVIQLISTIYVFYRLMRAAFDHVPVPGVKRLRFVFALVATSPLAIAIALVNRIFGIDLNIYLFILLVGFVYLGLLYKLCSDAYATNVVLPSLAVLFAYLIGNDLVERIFKHHIDEGWWMVPFGIFFFILYFFLVIMHFVAKGLADAILSESLSVLGSTPLKTKLRRILDNKRIVIKTQVTVAEKIEVFDPDDCVWTTTENARFPHPDKVYCPNEKKIWYPSYMDSQQLSLDEAVSYCSASAAIPFGIVEKIEIGGKQYVDGGVVDNCPLLPVFEAEGIEEIFIVLLKPYGSDEEAILKEGISFEACAARHRLSRLREIPIPRCGKYGAHHYWTAKNVPPRILPYTLPDRQLNLVFFYPKETLGNMFSGVLNFSERYAGGLIKKGRYDALNKLSSCSITADLDS